MPTIRSSIARWARYHRLSASPGAVATILRMMADADVRDVLGAVRVPTLVAHVPGRREEAEYLTARIPHARRFEVPGPDFAIYLQTETLLPEVERFVSTLGAADAETVLATVLFTDIVGSTEKPAEIGDGAGVTSWSDTTRSCGRSSRASEARKSTR
jgi:hypothetical protein